jgi:hypothetical protein
MTVIKFLQKIQDNTLRRLAIHNILIQHNNDDEYIVNMYRNCTNISAAINEFIWTKTTEGPRYWALIRDHSFYE